MPRRDAPTQGEERRPLTNIIPVIGAIVFGLRTIVPPLYSDQSFFVRGQQTEVHVPPFDDNGLDTESLLFLH